VGNNFSGAEQKDFVLNICISSVNIGNELRPIILVTQ